MEKYKKYVLDFVSDLDGKVEKRARKPWITQESSLKWMSEGMEEFQH